MKFFKAHWLEFVILGTTALTLYILYRVYQAAQPAIAAANQASTSPLGQLLAKL